MSRRPPRHAALAPPLRPACTLTATVVICRTLLPPAWPRWEIAVLAGFAFIPSTAGLWFGQMEPVVLLLVALALREWMRGREVRCGALIGVAAALKLGPLV